MASEEVCSRQKAAAPALVKARDDGAAIDEVIVKVKEGASSQASADVLTESVKAIYADKALDSAAAGDMIYKRCIDALGK